MKIGFQKFLESLFLSGRFTVKLLKKLKKSRIGFIGMVDRVDGFFAVSVGWFLDPQQLLPGNRGGMVNDFITNISRNFIECTHGTKYWKRNALWIGFITGQRTG